MLMLSYDLNNSRVALIGVAKYDKEEKLEPLPAVINNLIELQRILVNPEIIGFPSENIALIRDPESANDLGTRLAQLARQATDCFIVYYSGHGLKARTTKGLYLATSESTEDECEFNGLALETLKRAI